MTSSFGVIGAFDEDIFGLDVSFPHRTGAVDIRSALMSRVLVVFPFDPKINLISSSDFLVVLSKTVVKVALVAF